METSNTNNGNEDLNVCTDTIADVHILDLKYLHPNAVDHELHHNPVPQKPVPRQYKKWNVNAL